MVLFSTMPHSLFMALMTGAKPHADPSPTRKIYILIMLGLVTALAMMDRNILNILLIPIQNEIGASDTAMGLLTGTAFAAAYATAAIPLSRIADRGNRRSLLAAALAVWSGATALCGLAASYMHLLLARVGVAGGEAAANPAIMSMISDLYPPNRRATAIGCTLIGTGVGVFMGAAFGGYISDTIGWRTAFVVVGLPGVLIALVIWLTVPEPIRGASEGGLTPDPDSETLRRTIRYLARIPSFRYIVLAKSFVQIASQAAMIWFPAYLIRVHDMSVMETGFWYGMAIAGATIVAAVLGGTASDYLARRGTVWYLRFCMFSMATSLPCAIVLAFAGSQQLALVMVFLYGTFSAMNTTPSMAAALAIVRPRMRGFMTAVVNFCFNFIGAGIGGLLIGALNDALAPRFGEEAIRYSLLSMPVVIVLAALFYWLATRTIEADVQTAQSPSATPSSDHGRIKDRDASMTQQPRDPRG